MFKLLIILVLAVLMDACPAFALSAPTVTPTTGSFATPQVVTISAAGAEVLFTVDGTNPASSGSAQRYTQPIIIDSPTQLNAIAQQAGVFSPITTVFLNVDPNLVPVLQRRLILNLSSSLGVLTGVGSPAPVEEWADLSGAGNNATANAASAPVLLSGPVQAVNFNGTSQFLSLPSGFNYFASGVTVFLVVQPNTPSTGARFFDLGNGSSSNNLFMSEPSTSAADLHVVNGSTDSSVSSSSAISIGQFQLIEGSYDGSSTGKIFTNGIEDAQSTSMQPIQTIARSKNFIGQASGGGNFYSGNIVEMLVYAPQLGDAQRAAVEASLIQKFQLLSAAPAAPVISVPSGTLGTPTQIALYAPAGSVIRFTTDGSTPGPSSNPYSCPINVTFSETIKAIAIFNGVQSSVASASYVLDSTQFPAPSSSDMTAPTINLTLPAPTF